MLFRGYLEDVWVIVQDHIMLLEVLDTVFFSVVVFKKEVFPQVVAGKDLVSILLADFLIDLMVDFLIDF